MYGWRLVGALLLAASTVLVAVPVAALTLLGHPVVACLLLTAAGAGSIGLLAADDVRHRREVRRG
jgi:hypothetical protein